MKQIYLDNAATTQVDPKVLKAMLPYFTNYYGNASEPHSMGIKANNAIDKSREIIAKFLGADPSEIIFTSCATESINLAHKGLIELYFNVMEQDPSKKLYRRPHIITTKIEHKAVLESCKHTKAEITCVGVDDRGLLRVEDIEKSIKKNTLLISVMYVNNETGIIQPIKEIGKMIKKYNKKHHTRIYFHVDATQAIQYLNCNVDDLGVDLLSFTGHKIYAPKGIGALYIRKNVLLIRQQDGGGQEFGLRSGTENVPYIVGLGEAIRQITNKLGKYDTKMVELKHRLIKEIVFGIPMAKFVGHICDKGVPHIACFVFKGVRGEDIVLELSKRGISGSSGSACNTGNLEVSHVLKSMGISDDWAKGQLRLSLSKYTRIEDVLQVAKILKKALNILRNSL